MDFITNVFENGDYLSALVATAAAFVLGFIWFNPAVFGKIWMQGEGLTEEDIKKGNMATIMGTNAVVTYLAALALSTMVFSTEHGLKFGLFIGIFWGATSYIMHNIYAQKSGAYIAQGALYSIVHFGVMGLVLGLMA